VEDDTGKAHLAEESTEYSFLDDINPDSVRVIRAYVEPGLKDAAPEERFQFERHGYFVADLRDSKPGRPVFNRAVTLKDSWGKQGG
jgi:glutaminyl-tRNA synthetase